MSTNQTTLASSWSVERITSLITSEEAATQAMKRFPELEREFQGNPRSLWFFSKAVREGKVFYGSTKPANVSQVAQYAPHPSSPVLQTLDTPQPLPNIG